jgi:prepilin-type N-terminal cleavage/methylation domain-containing protein
MTEFKSRTGASGYTLVEMLVVVTIIGILSLVSVPAFTTYYRTSKMRTSLRQFTADVRIARTKAISDNTRTSIGVVPGSPGTAGQYALFRENVDASTSPPTRTWVLMAGPKRLDESVYFLDSRWPDEPALDDTYEDVTFRSNGTSWNLTQASPVPPSPPTIVLRSRHSVPNNRCTITFSASGSFSTACDTLP